MPTFWFMQLADPQFGMFAAFSGRTDEQLEAARERVAPILPQGPTMPAVPVGITDREPEMRRLQAALSVANNLRPAFVVVCGDLIHNLDQPEQRDDLLSITRGLSDDIPLRFVPGNHDLSLDWAVPTPEGLSEYRDRHGEDYYAFEHGETLFLALNSETFHRPDNMPEEAERQLDFVRDQLTSQRGQNAQHVVAFMHTPLFWNDPEEDRAGAISPENRLRLLSLFREHGVDAVFAGHLHHNRYATDGDMQMVVSGAVGYPLAGESGYRMVEVSDAGISHEFTALGDGLAMP